MDLGNMKVKVSADINDLLNNMGKAEKSLQDFKDQLARFQSALNTNTNPESILRLNRAIEATSNKIKLISTAGLSKQFGGLSSVSNSAAQSLTNVGRVAQDLPFGFMGIQNNLNPLLESFQRLKAETGSSKLALQALGNSLMGAGGLGLALSLVSGAILIYQNGISGFNKKNSDAKKNIDAIKESLEKYIKTLDDVTAANLKGSQNAQEQLVKLETLYKATQNANIPLADRKKLVDQLQEQYPKYFKNISDEVILAGGATKSYNELSTAILASARARAGQDFLIDIQKQILTLEQKQTDNYKEQLTAYGALKKAQKKPDERLNRDEMGIVIKSREVAEYKLNQKVSEGNELKKETNALLLKAKAISDDITKGIVKNPGSLLDPTGKIDAEKKKRDIETIADVLAKLDRQIAVINQEEIIFNTDKTKEKISAVESAISNLVNKFKLTASSPLILNLEARIQGIKLDEFVKNVFKNNNLAPIQLPFEIVFDNSPTNEGKLAAAKKALEDQMGNAFGKQGDALQLGLSINPFANEGDVDRAQKTAFLVGAGFKRSMIEGMTSVPFNKFYDDFIAKMKEFQNLVSGSLSQIGTNAFSALGDAIGSIGKDDVVKGLFDSIFSSVGEQIQALGKFLIQSGIQIKIAKEAFKKLLANPIAAIAVGIGLVALGALIKNSVGKKVPGFAGGVQNFSGGLAVVGERGPELVNLPRGSDVIPNNRLRESFGGGRQEIFIPNVTLRGQDLVVAFERTQRTISRNG